MATHYIANESSGNQYYFNAANATTSHSYGNFTSPVTSTYGSSVYSAYPISISSTSNQQTRLDNSYQTPQQYQSVAGFNKSVTQHDYQPSHSSAPQTRTTVRAVTNQDLYALQRSPQPTLISPQQHHFQFDNRQQPGHPAGPPVVYQTPGAAQFTHRNVDLWTEGSYQNPDHYVQAQRVSVRSVSTGSPQQSHSVSPQRHQDQLQKYYSQLTPEQHQQLLRNQQLQRQQEHNSHHEQQPGVTAQHISPSFHHVSEQHRSTSGFDGGQNNQQRRVRSDSERQQQDEQDYYAAQQRFNAQRAQQKQGDPASRPVGIRTLASKFAAPASGEPRSKSTSARQYSSSNQTYASGPRQTTTTRSLTSHSMTYSSLPKPQEPPVNSVEYYQMQKQAGGSFASIQQAAAPPHIQHTATGFGALYDRFTKGSPADDVSQSEIVNRQQQQQPTNIHNGGNSLSSLRNQFINQAKQSTYDPSAGKQAQKISRTIVGEDVPQLYQAQQASVYQSPVQQQKPIASQTAPQKPQQQPIIQVTQTQQQQPIIQVTQTQQQQPIIQVTQPQQPKPQVTQPQQQQSPPQVAPQQQQQQQESVAEAPVQQKQESAPETPFKQEQESAPEASVKQEQESAPEVLSPPKEEPVPETSQKQAEPATETLKQEAESTPPASKPKTEATPQTAKPKTESSPQAGKSQSPSTTQTAKKEPAKATTKPADKKSSPS